MRRRRIQHSQRLPGALPVIALECVRVPRLALLSGVPSLAVVAALLTASEPAFALRLALAAGLIAVALPVLRECLGAHGRRSVRAFLWDARGQWWLTDRDGVCLPASLRRAQVLGPFVFMTWRDGERRLRRGALDIGICAQAEGRAFLGRLRLLRDGATRNA